MTDERTTEQSTRETLRHYREVVSAVVGALRSAEVNRSFASFSLEEAIDQAIERIEGEPPQGTTRTNKLAQVDRIKQDLEDAIEGIRETDPDAFRQANPSQDVNTAPEPEEDP
jgi:hypothetical protein